MPAITVDTIATSFRAAIEALTPRMTEGASTRTWKYTDDPGAAVRPDARWFRFEWDGEGDTPEGFMGPILVDTTVTCSIFVDYGGIPERRVRIIAADDAHQLRDVLNRLKNSATGLRWVELIKQPEAFAFASNNTDRNQARCVIKFLVRYMKARG